MLDNEQINWCNHSWKLTITSTKSHLKHVLKPHVGNMIWKYLPLESDGC